MKILWLCSTMTPDIANELKVKSAVNVSWIVNALNCLKATESVDIGICFPMTTINNIKEGTAHGVRYYGFPQDKPDPTTYNAKLEKYFEYVIGKFKPDVVHIWGTEYPHTLSMLRACEKQGLLDKAVVSIQGLCHVIAKHYFSLLNNKILNRFTFRDILKGENIKKQKKVYEKRGFYEIEALKLAKNVIGRTDWDEACTKQISPELNYYFCNETLREAFYNNRWDIDKCQRHSIFISQGYYPIKGLHFVLEALAILKKEYSDVTLYIGGLDMVNRGWKISSYGKHIKELIKKYGLCDNVCFTGMLNEEEMCRQYLKANVFVSASSIENSPNSVGEAMLLGMPVISSDVGGVKNLLDHGKEGYIYPYDEPYMIAYYAKKIFDDDKLAIEIGERVHEKAMLTHDRQKNLDDLISIYQKLN